ncbi:hypothetical protein RB653_004117 [Dictyostelium firmibasis]|uniref:Uncharacterized protein n=1 Tax=Dictyostelium firmibasis TaxID=79012 RepID=A0AAN7YZS0_9MYCE
MKIILNIIFIILISIKIVNCKEFVLPTLQDPQQKRLDQIKQALYCLIEPGLNFKTYSSSILKTNSNIDDETSSGSTSSTYHGGSDGDDGMAQIASCYRYNHSSTVSLNCEGDKNQEWKKTQNSRFSIDQYIIVEDIVDQITIQKGYTKIITIEQRFKTIPSENGSVIINNVNEHIAYFQAAFNVENSLQNLFNIEMANKERHAKKTVKLSFYNYTDPYGIHHHNDIGGNGLNDNNNNIDINNNEWDISLNYDKEKDSCAFFYYQKNPIDTMTSTPDNTRQWFKESARKMKSGKQIASISFTGIDGFITSKWIVPSDVDTILLNVTYTSTMADIVLSARHIENNSYKLADFGFYDIKKLDLKTGLITPIEKQYFNRKIQQK